MRGFLSFNRAGSHVFVRVTSLVLVFGFVLSPAQPAFADFGGTQPTVPNAQVFTANDAPKVDGQSGAFTQRVPLDIPPGRNGLQPDVSLQYNSQNTSDSIVGYGWSLSIPYIQRLNKTGSQNLYTSQYFTSSTDGELVVDATTSTGIAASSNPTIMDTTTPTVHAAVNTTSQSFTYNVPSGGTNKVFLVLMGKNAGNDPVPTMTLNGQSLTVAAYTNAQGNLTKFYYGYLVAPTSGTFSVSFSSATYADYVVLTLQNAAQTGPVDVTNVATTGGGTSVTVNATTTNGYDALLSFPWFTRTKSLSSFGAGETSYVTELDDTNFGARIDGATKAAAASSGTESMTTTISAAGTIDESIIGIKPNAVAATSSTPLSNSATTSPSVLDTLPLSLHSASSVTSASTTYTVPSGGTNKLMIALIAKNDCTSPGPSATQNGVALTIIKYNGSFDRACYYVGYLAAPTSGAFQVTFPNTSSTDFVLMTLKDAAQSNAIDAANVTTAVTSTILTPVTTTVADDLLISFPKSVVSFASNGPGETQYLPPANDAFGYTAGSFKSAASSTGLESMSVVIGPPTQDIDEPVVAVKPAVLGSAAYRARVDDGSYNSYSLSNNTWTVYDKKGTRYLYGSDDSGRMFDASSTISNQTSKWMLQEVRDTNDNYIKYSYLRDTNEIYPYKIVYTGHGSTDGIDTITFATSTRPDMRVSDAFDFPIITTKRISEIDALVNGTTVRKYPLAYGVGDNGFRSLLTSVQQQGYDDNNNLTSLPPMTFAYATTSLPFYSQSASLTVNGQAYTIADTNGNGINDVNEFYVNGGSVASNMYIDQSSLVTSVVPPDYWGQTGTPPIPLERGVRYIDVNGDGKADVVKGYWNYTTSTSTNAIYINGYTAAGGYTWAATSTSNATIPIFDYDGSGSIHNGTTGIFGDVNGDGLPDYELYLSGMVGPSAYTGNGLAWDTTTYFTPTQTMPYAQQTPTASQLIDINGDGLDDWVYSDGTNIYVNLNTGTGWQSGLASQWTIATSTLCLSPGSSPPVYYDRGIRFMDINGDGLPDFVRAYQQTSSACSGSEIANVTAVYLNTGYGWATSTSSYVPSYITTCNTGTGALQYNEYGNWNGNGQMSQDVLKTVTNPKGGSTSVTYTPSAQLGTNANLPVSLLVATQSVTNDGRGNNATTTYSYAGGKQYTSSGVRDRKFAGFAISTTTAPDSVTATYYDQGDDVQTSRGEQSDGYAQINHPFRKDVFDLSSNLKQRTYYRWDAYQHGTGNFVGLGQQLTEDFASDGSHRDKAVTYQYSQTNDGLLKTTQYGEVTGNSDGTFTDLTGDTRTTNILYAASSTVDLSLPIEKTILDNNAATSSDQKLYYDSLTFGQVGLGNNTRQEDWISGSSYASSTNTFNSYGLVATSTDRRGNATSYVYDAYNLFPATTTNALLQKTQFYYNYANGKAKQSIDPNNRLTKNIFDGLGRLTEVDQSDVTTPTSYATSTTYQYTDSTTTPSLVHRSDYLTATNTVETYDYSDGLGRLVQERKASQTAGIYAAFDKVYNLAGELASQSLPYFSAGSSFTSPTASSLLYTNYTYDPLQRMLTTGNIVGTTTNTYSKWTTTTADPNNNVKDYTFDAFGNLANVVEYGTPNASTTYAYDSLNDLATTTDGSGNVRGFTYDGLSRRLTAQDLHAPADGAFGTWSYSYDDGSNLTSQTDPKGQTVNRTYDALNRMVTEDYTGQSGTEVALTYDSCANGKSYLCTASSSASFASSTYDILGRVATNTVTVSGTPYSMSYAYDRQGNVTSLTYPNSSQVTYNYNLMGLPNRIQRKPSGGSFSDIISNYDYAPQGQIQNARFGNNASTTYFYNASAMYRLSQLQTTAASSTKIQNFAYTYDPVGNITQLANTASTSANATTAYTYDALNRLLIASTLTASSSPYSQTLTYDVLGNILTNALGNGTSTYSGTMPSIMDSTPLTVHAAVNTTSQSFSYTVPSGGSNKVFVVVMGKNDGNNLPSAMTLNGQSLTQAQFTNHQGNLTSFNYAYLVSPSSGTFSVTFTGNTYADYVVFTLQDAAPTNPIDVSNVATTLSGASQKVNATTTVGNDLLLSFPWFSRSNAFTSFGGSETSYVTQYDDANFGSEVVGSKKSAGVLPATESMTTTINAAGTIDEPIIAFRPVTAPSGGPANTYTYAGTGYANPDAVTQIANGLSTTTFQYDNNGNVAQKTTDGTTTTYIYDYANRLTALGAGGATTTYGYDAFGQRMLQTGTSTTTIYPFKWYSVASSTGSGAKYATTTSYIFNGDTLLATVDQQTASGNATGTAQIRYIHPDHLGSTNVVTNESGALVQTLDYYPYGGTRISVGTSTNEKRKFIGQFTDDSTLSYLNARYYSPTQGQFISEDPSFLSVGDPRRVQQVTGQGVKSFLADPQQMNSYNYGRDNPITNKDPNGNNPLILGGAVLGDFYGIGQQVEYDLASGQTSSVPTYVAAGLKGSAQGAATAASLYYLGPVTALEYYGYYQTYKGLRDFNEHILSTNSVNYTEQQQRMTAGGVWLDAVQRIASAFTPMPARAGYDAATSILNSLIQISNTLSTMQTRAQNTSAGSQTTNRQSSSSGGAGGGLPSTVVQNGVTYVRNSSGLLNIAK